MNAPNIVLLIIDTQRRDNLSCYGYERETSPNLDRIAGEGALYLNAISPGGWTLPSHASIFTGRYMCGHGASIAHEYAHYRYPTLAELLSDAGYATVGINNNDWADVALGMQERGESPPGFDEYYSGDRYPGQKDRGALVSRAIEWLHAHDADQPFFMFMNLPYPHLRCWPPQPFRGTFLPAGVTDEQAAATNQDVYRFLTGEVEMDDRDWQIVKALNDGETAYTDQQIGALIAELECLGILDQTLLFVTSDHGDILGGRGPLIAHQLHLYDELIHLPLIVRYPDRFAGGTVVEGLAQTHDIFATVVELAGLDAPQSDQSVSLLDIAAGRARRAFAVAERAKPVQFFERVLRRYPDYDPRPYNAACKVYRTLEEKYIWWSNGCDELYDLRVDPGETRNLVQEWPAKAAQMRRALLDWLLAADPVDYGDALNDIGGIKGVRPEIVRQLQAWGLYREVRL